MPSVHGDSPVRRRLSPATRRMQIIESATEQIAQVGFNAFTLARVAAECGITRSAILHYFLTKEELLVAVLQRRDDVDEQALREISSLEPASSDGSPSAPNPDDARRILSALVHRNYGQREIVRLYSVLGAEALDESHPAHAFFEARLSLTRTLIARLGEGWHPAPDRLAVEVLSFMDGLQINWLRDDRLDFEGLWSSFADRTFV